MTYVDPAVSGIPATGNKILAAWGAEVTADIEYLKALFDTGVTTATGLDYSGGNGVANYAIISGLLARFNSVEIPTPPVGSAGVVGISQTIILGVGQRLVSKAGLISAQGANALGSVVIAPATDGFTATQNCVVYCSGQYSGLRGLVVQAQDQVAGHVQSYACSYLATDVILEDCDFIGGSAFCLADLSTVSSLSNRFHLLHCNMWHIGSGGAWTHNSFDANITNPRVSGTKVFGQFIDGTRVIGGHIAGGSPNISVAGSGVEYEGTYFDGSAAASTFITLSSTGTGKPILFNGCRFVPGALGNTVDLFNITGSCVLVVEGGEVIYGGGGGSNKWGAMVSGSGVASSVVRFRPSYINGNACITNTLAAYFPAGRPQDYDFYADNASTFTGRHNNQIDGGFAYVTGLVNDGGATDQTQAFVNASNLIGNSGTLYVPAGTYGLVWSVPADITLMGAGSGAQSADGSTMLTLPSGNTTATYCLNLAGNRSKLMFCDVDAQGRGIVDAGSVGYAASVIMSGSDNIMMNTHIKGGTFVSLWCQAGSNRSRLMNVTTENANTNILVRTITGTVSASSGGFIVQDSAASFTMADIGRGVGADSAAGFRLGTRLNASATVASGSNGATLTSLVGSTLSASPISGSLTALPASGSLQVIASGGTAVLSYTAVAGGNFSISGIVSGTGSWTVATGNNIVCTKGMTLDQSASAAVVAGTMTVTQGYTAILAGVDVQATGCRFVTGTTIVGDFGAPSGALQFTQTHFTNTNTSSPSHQGNVLLESSAYFWGCYLDSCPINSSAVVHKQGVKQCFFHGTYTFNNVNNHNYWLTENATTTGVTVRGLFMQPPQGAWTGLVNLAAGANSHTVFVGVDATDGTVFQGTTLASLFTGGGSTVPPFGCGQVSDVSVNGVQWTASTQAVPLVFGGVTDNQPALQSALGGSTPSPVNVKLVGTGTVALKSPLIVGQNQFLSADNPNFKEGGTSGGIIPGIVFVPASGWSNAIPSWAQTLYGLPATLDALVIYAGVSTGGGNFYSSGGAKGLAFDAGGGSGPISYSAYLAGTDTTHQGCLYRRGSVGSLFDGGSGARTNVEHCMIEGSTQFGAVVQGVDWKIDGGRIVNGSHKLNGQGNLVSNTHMTGGLQIDPDTSSTPGYNTKVQARMGFSQCQFDTCPTGNQGYAGGTTNAGAPSNVVTGITISAGVATIQFTSNVPSLSTGTVVILSGWTTTTGSINGAQTLTGVSGSTATFSTAATGPVTVVGVVALQATPSNSVLMIDNNNDNAGDAVTYSGCRFHENNNGYYGQPVIHRAPGSNANASLFVSGCQVSAVPATCFSSVVDWTRAGDVVDVSVIDAALQANDTWNGGASVAVSGITTVTLTGAARSDVNLNADGASRGIGSLYSNGGYWYTFKFTGISGSTLTGVTAMTKVGSGTDPAPNISNTNPVTYTCASAAFCFPGGTLPSRYRVMLSNSGLLLQNATFPVVVASGGGSGVTTTQTLTWTPPTATVTFRVSLFIQVTTAGTSTVPVIAFTRIGGIAFSQDVSLTKEDGTSTAVVPAGATVLGGYTASFTGRTNNAGAAITLTITPTGSTFAWGAVIEQLTAS